MNTIVCASINKMMSVQANQALRLKRLNLYMTRERHAYMDDIVPSGSAVSLHGVGQFVGTMLATGFSSVSESGEGKRHFLP